MEIIHISGTQCSGKTFVIKQFLDRDDVAFWDVLDLYEREGCIVNGIMDWDCWEATKPKIIPDMLKFIQNNSDKRVVFIESGTNQTINRCLSTMTEPVVTHIQLKTPPVKVVQARAEERKINVKRALEFRQKFQERHAGNDMHQLTQEEAALAIKARLDGIKMAVIGTAGRKEDGPKMSRALYVEMYQKALDIMARLQLKPEHVTAVSGGAAWANHIAVSLYLGDKVHNLTLYFPATFEFMAEGGPQFIGDKTADTVNYYHRLFSQKMGGPTRVGITKALDKGARAVTVLGFKARNLMVADCDLMVAFTWGEGSEPKPGGTHHTWSHSAAPVKIHVPLKELQKES